MKKRPATKSKEQAAKIYPQEGLATVRDASEFLKLSRWAIYRLVARGVIQRAEMGNGTVRLPWKRLHELELSVGAPRQRTA